jgi:hypothetical protein
MKGALPWLVRWSRRAGTVQLFFVLPWLLELAYGTIFFFLTAHYFNSFIPIARQAGLAVVLGRLSLSSIAIVNILNDDIRSSWSPLHRAQLPTYSNE